MNNILALAHKELKGYFASPIAYVLMGFFAILYGFFFSTILLAFVDQSAQLGGQAINLNDQLVRPFFLNVDVIFLFALPLITMRSYAEEKRSGTIELLLTSPLTDMEIVLGKFLGAMGLILAILAVTLPHVAVLFIFARPEWKPLLTTYFGFLLMTGCVVAIGLFISSLTRNQIIAGMVTFAVFLILWIIDWLSPFMWPRAQSVSEYLSITRHFDDFTRGILDTRHVVYYASLIAIGLFLTARSLDSERWRG